MKFITVVADFNSVVMIATIVLFIVAIATVIYIAISKNNQMVLIKKNIDQKKEFDATILQTQIEIQEQTLKTISQEIHDNVGQILSLIKLTLSSIKTTDLDVENKTSTAKTLLSKAIIDLKNISNSLNTDTIESIGLATAIENEIELINKTNIKAVFNTNGNAERLNPKTELILFRMVQESLNNAIKHAKAKLITITANYTNDAFELCVNDDGVGFNIEKINAKGLGLRNMQNRVKFINASLNIDSNVYGTEVRIYIPKIAS